MVNLFIMLSLYMYLLTNLAYVIDYKVAKTDVEFLPGIIVELRL